MGHGLKYTWRDLMTVLKVKGVGVNPAYLLYLMTNIYNILEDVFSVGSVEEIQEAIDEIGTDSGTLFIESGMYDITVPIDIDNCGSIVIYGHGDNTILKPADGITVFNITCCSSLLVKTLKIDASNYTAPNINVPLVLVNETLDNVVSFQDVTIEGLNNFGRGIELQSNNCIIENCNITFLSYGINVISDSNIISQNTASLNEIGINVAGSYCTITGNTCSSNTILGIYLNSAIYDNVSNNICNINPTGISLNLSSNNTIANNIASSNTFNGIYLSGSSYNTLSGNTCENNDSNTAGNTAGIHILANSDFNTISANSSNNNNNAGAGTAYGIYIAAATCDENVIASNNTNGNDVDLMDAGTATTVEYYVQDEWELQDAIDSIGTKAGVINIDASFTINAPITILGGGSYIIQGEGSNSTLTTGDNQCFNITSARSVLLQNFKIDVSAITGRNTVIIEVDEAADNLVVIDNIEIVGIVARGWGVDVVSDYVQIRNCNFSTIDMGIHISGNNCKAESNVLNGMDEYGIDCIGDYAIIINNTCNSSNVCGIQMNGGSYCNVSQNQCHSNANYGIFVFSLDNMVLADNICTLNDAGIKIEDSNYVSVSNNTSSSNTTTGIMITGTSSNNIVLGNTCDNNAAGYGIIIGAATCVDNIVKSNNTSGNNWNLWDLGTNSDFEYRCSTEAEIQNALDSIAAKSGIIEILTGIINITGTINIDGNGLYIIKGNGDGTILTPSGDFSVFDITSCISCVLRDFKIDSQNIVSNDTNIIDINEDNVFIEKVNIVGDADKKGYGIYVETGKTDIKISYCNISYCYIGIYYLGIGCSISNNIINYCSNDGIYFDYQF
nr:MAG: glycoside hydrolase, family 110 [uncultured archaeon]